MYSLVSSRSFRRSDSLNIPQKKALQVQKEEKKAEAPLVPESPAWSQKDFYKKRSHSSPSTPVPQTKQRQIFLWDHRREGAVLAALLEDEEEELSSPSTFDFEEVTFLSSKKKGKNAALDDPVVDVAFSTENVALLDGTALYS